MFYSFALSTRMNVCSSWVLPKVETHCEAYRPFGNIRTRIQLSLVKEMSLLPHRRTIDEQAASSGQAPGLHCSRPHQ